MKPGTIVKVPDGRIGTIVYHGLEGYGVIWGSHIVDENNLPEYEAMLREPSFSERWGCECVGEKIECEIISGPIVGLQHD